MAVRKKGFRLSALGSGAAVLALVLVFGSPAVPFGLPAVQSQTRASNTQLITLGTGNPVPDPDRWGPANAVVVGNRLFLVDAGAGVTRRLAAAGFPRINKVEATFITHLHSDHTLGYPDLIFTTWIMDRRGPLVVYGPPGLRHMTEAIMDAWREDIDIRANGLERQTRDWLKVDIHEIEQRPVGQGSSVASNVIYNNSGIKVTAIPVSHGSWKYAFAYRFDTADRSITLSGDTSPNRALVEAAKGTDVLLHEAYNSAGVRPEDRPGGEFWPEYERTYHTSDVELGRIAAEVKPKLLVVTHLGRMGATDAEIIAHIRSGGYTGPVVIAKDLQRF